MIYLLPHAVDRAAEAWADHDAVVHEQQRLSYSELALQANVLAHCLREAGVRRGDRVGILMHKGIESAIAIHGIMKAGAAYVPLDPSAPVPRQQFVMRDCDIQHLVTRPGDAALTRAAVHGQNQVQWVLGLEPGEIPDKESVSWPEMLAMASHVETASYPPRVGLVELDLAYILYTSGSTGTPKGIMHTHRSALSWANVAAQTYGFHEHDRISNYAPLHFDLSTLDYFSTAVAGAAAIIIPEPYARLPASLSQLIAAHGMTVLYCVPLALTQLLLHGALESRDLSRLRWVLFGGEPMPVTHIKQLMDKLPNAQFANVYGPTETNGCTHFVLPPSETLGDRPLPIGRPYDNVELKVISEDGEQVESGGEGELVVRAPTMMAGYWSRGDLNAHCFHREPVVEGFEKVFHRTGDLVRQRDDGNFEFLGRKDRQIKTRGHRVELDEVEAVFLSHPHIASAAAVACPDELGSCEIAVFVVLSEPEELATLRKHAGDRLPPYAMPRSLEIRQSLPLTSTGKIDRKALLDPRPSHGELS